MPMADTYTVRASNTLNTASQTLVLGLVSPTTKRAWITGVRMEITASSASAGSSALFQLVRPGNTPNSASGSGGVTPTAQDFSAAAALAAAWSSNAGMTTAPTAGVVLAEWTLPQTTGSAWEEFPPLGYEWGVPAIATNNANSGVWLFVTGATGSTTYVTDFIFTE